MKTLSFEHFSANSTPKIEITSPCSQSTSFLVTSFVGKHSLNSWWSHYLRGVNLPVNFTTS
jgi:hypothetical protein